MTSMNFFYQLTLLMMCISYEIIPCVSCNFITGTCQVVNFYLFNFALLLD